MSVSDLAAQNSSFQYNANGDLIKHIMPKGGEFDYVYDPVNRNMTKATSATGVEYLFEYDTYGNPEISKVSDGVNYIKATAEYEQNGNYFKKITGASGEEIVYTRNTTTGLVTSVSDPLGSTEYLYDSMQRVETVTRKQGLQTLAQVGYVYDKDRLKQINKDGFGYYFGYDSLGYTDTVKVGQSESGAKLLMKSHYEVMPVVNRKTGRLTKSEYGNGHIFEYGYDSLNRVESIRYGEKDINGNYTASEKFKYSYTPTGELGITKDFVNNRTIKYDYDLAQRLAKISGSNGYVTKFSYDKNNNLFSLVETIDGNSMSSYYYYDADNRPIRASLGSTYESRYEYDGLGRIARELTSHVMHPYNPPRKVMDYTYKPGVNGSQTTRVATTNDGYDLYAYDYDVAGNITALSVTNSLTKQSTYVYDGLGQLVRENSQSQNKTFVFIYDQSGNILEKKEYEYTTGTPQLLLQTYTYSYGDSTWQDKLTNFKLTDNVTSQVIFDQAITYPTTGDIGNPLTYRGYNLTWKYGRQLYSMVGNGKTLSFKYDDNGIRTQKSVNGVATNYHTVGGKVTYEKTGTQGIYYYYDGAGNLFSMRIDNTFYYYLKNVQGDITGLIDNNGTRVVSYTYDAWGKLLSTTGTLASTIGQINPFRYRGYYYDKETGLYYLQSRYYDPVTSRWLNADDGIDVGAELLGYNMFQYCANNPVNNADPTGEFVITTLVICVVAGAIIGGATGGYASKKIYGKVKWEWVAGGAVVGGALGYFAAPAVASATGVAGVSITLQGGITLIPTTLLGQYHHVLTNPLMKALNSHSLKGLFQRTGSIVQALYQYSHKGYQTWHRAIDNYMVKWLQNHPNATSNQFWRELYNQYNTKDMIKRFGEGVLDYIKKQIK